jgi:hypothetical protein
MVFLLARPNLVMAQVSRMKYPPLAPLMRCCCACHYHIMGGHWITMNNMYYGELVLKLERPYEHRAFSQDQFPAQIA